MAKTKAKKPAKKRQRKKAPSKKPGLNEFQLKYARKLKFTPGLQFLLMEFVMLALNLSGNIAEDKIFARKTMHDLKREVK